MSFSYEDAEDGDDMLNISFADPYGELVDSDAFIENTEWTVQWGFAGYLREARKVLVKRTSYRFGQVEVECLDKGSSMRLEERWDVVKGKTKKDIIGMICSRYGLIPVIDPQFNEIIPNFNWGGKTDYDVLQYLRSRSPDHTFKILADKLIFRRRRLDAPPLSTFDYQPGINSRLINFEISVKDQDNASAATQVTAVTIDPMSHKPITYKADESTTKTDSLGNTRPTDNFKKNFGFKVASIFGINRNGGKTTTKRQGNSTGKAMSLPPQTTQDLQNIAQSKRRQAMLSSVEATFEILAKPDDPMLQSGDNIEVRGIGKKFSGLYQIVKITHNLDEAYKYNIEARRNAVGAVSGQKLVTPLNGAINTKFVDVIKYPTKKKEITGTLSGGRISSVRLVAP